MQEPRAPFYTGNRGKKQNKKAPFAVLVRNSCQRCVKRIIRRLKNCWKSA
ncbi:unknown protein [Cronobacter turicensis z3032]|uniref:Uncharacterized protein n=1 Tax=Cronobacter turicensis (strain DSM 18703 / CCUG 55852 / LMG 23827 / z3032) TaxID=693216 RepID=C9XZV0_CROTZ|nr:unknown protein [Cronobacter turicensis z3032]